MISLGAAPIAARLKSLFPQLKWLDERLLRQGGQGGLVGLFTGRVGAGSGVRLALLVLIATLLGTFSYGLVVGHRLPQ